jgi:PEP-CTERM motif
MKQSFLCRIKFAAVLALAMGAAAPVDAGMNLVQNGDFSSGSFSPYWALAGDSSGAFVTSGQLNGSTYQAALTTNANDNGSLTQSLSTMAGQEYMFSFLLGGDGATANAFSASLGSSTLVNLTNVSNTLPLGTTYSVDYTATSSSTGLSFTFDDAPGYLYLTNVSVVALTSSVPEPSTILSVGLGVLMVAGHRWRQHRQSSRT